MEAVKDFVGRHGEKVLFGIVLTVSLGVVIFRATTDEDLRGLVEDHERAVATIEGKVQDSRRKAGDDRRSVEDLGALVADGYRPARPDGDLGPLAGLAVYLPAFPDTKEEEEVVAVPPAPLPHPEGLRVASASPQRLEVEWTPVAGAEAYVVSRQGGVDREWRVKEPRLADDSVEGAATYRYSVQAIDASEAWGEIPGEVGAPIETTVPESAAIEFRSFQPSTGLATFRVRHYRDGTWYEKTLYDVKVGDRIGQVMGTGGRARHVQLQAEGGGATLQLDPTTPWVFEGVESEEVPVLLPQKEYLIRFGAGDGDVEWAASLAEFKSARPEHAAAARMEQGADGGFVSRTVDKPVVVDGRPRTKPRYKAVLHDVRSAGRSVASQVD